MSIIYIGADDKNIKLFEGQYVVPNGMSYNSYLIKDEKNVVLMSLEQYNLLMKAIRNSEYLDKIDKSIEQVEKGKTITKTIEELEAMENE